MVKTDLSGLGKWSNTPIDLACDCCGVEKTIKYKLYTSYGYVDGEYLCRNCKLKKNNLEKWGVDNVFQLESIKEKIKKTNLEKWGVENPSQNENINKKIKNSISLLDKDIINNKREITNLEKWGVKNVSQSTQIKNKKEETNVINWGKNYLETDEFKEYVKRTNLEKWGNEIYFKTDDFLYKSKKTNLEKWGVDNPSKNIEVNNKIKKTLNNSLNNKTINKFDNIININKDTFEIFCNSCKENFIINKVLFYKRRETKTTICTNCNHVDKHQSGKEILLFNFIKSIYNGEIIQNFRIERNEIDIYLPEINLGFEFNGVWWHSDEYKEKRYHLNKTKSLKEVGIKLIHIWEDDWDSKTDIIKSQINNWLGFSNKIWARKCEIREINASESIIFLNENHIQGGIGSSIKLGLYHNDVLVSLMTFDNLEGRKRMSIGNWNMNRFCNKLNTTVVGGASKLLNYFIYKYKPERIISYSDKDWSTGTLYEKLKFTKISESSVDYKYLVDGKRVHKSNFKGVENNISYPKIWDCGKIKWELLLNL